MPAPENLVSANGGSDWNCTTAGNTAICDANSPLAAGAGATAISIVVSIGAGVGNQTVDNTAVITPSTPDPVVSNNSSTDPTTIVAQADLALTKTASGSFIAGDDADYLIAVVNNGAGDAAAPLTVADTLPAGETFVSGTGTGWSCGAAGQVVTCTQASGLPDTQTAPQLTLQVHLGSSDTGTLVNSATVSSPTLDPNLVNNTGSASVVLSVESDLAILKSHAGVTFVAGADATYFLAVTNQGPSDDGAGIVVTDALPAGETYVGYGGIGWACTDAGQAVTCMDSQPLASGASATVIDMTVFVASSVRSSIVNTASVTGPNPDPNPANNTSTDSAAVVAEYALSLTKTLDGQLASGGSAVYTLTVANSGPSESALPLVVVDELPGGLVYDHAAGATPGVWVCTAPGRTITCTDTTIALGVGATSAILVTVRVTAGAGTRLVNTAQVSGPGDTGAPAETASVAGMVDAAISDPDTGSAFLIAMLPGILLVGPVPWRCSGARVAAGDSSDASVQPPLRGLTGRRKVTERIHRHRQFRPRDAETQTDVRRHSEGDPRGEQHATFGERIDEPERVGPWAAQPQVEAALRFEGVEPIRADAVHDQVAPLAIRRRIDLHESRWRRARCAVAGALTKLSARNACARPRWVSALTSDGCTNEIPDAFACDAEILRERPRQHGVLVDVEGLDALMRRIDQQAVDLVDDQQHLAVVLVVVCLEQRGESGQLAAVKHMAARVAR